MLGALLVLPILGWTGAHNEASRMAAVLGPPPFCRHAGWCVFGIYPDLINDWHITQGVNGRWAVWLLAREAVEALQGGDEARACILASIASHFPQDEICMSHSVILGMDEGPSGAWLWPTPLHPLVKRIPVERATLPIRRYGMNRPEEVIRNMGFFSAGVPVPQLLRPMYVATHRFSHDWLEGASAALAAPPERRRQIIGSETVAGHPGWTVEDIFPRDGGEAAPSVAWWYRRPSCPNWSFYHRWLLGHYQGWYQLPLAMFDEQSLRVGAPRLRDMAGLKAVFAEEFRAATEATVALYQYIAAAAHTDLRGDWSSPAVQDAFLAVNSIVLAADREDWRVAAGFVRQVIVQARTLRGESSGRSPVIVVGRVPDSGNVIRLEANASTRNMLRFRARGRGSQRFEFTMAASRVTPMGALVDLLLDQTKAPLWSTTPADKVVEALAQTWAGMALCRELKTRRRLPDELLAFVLPQGRSVPFRNTDSDKQHFKELTRDARPGNLEPWLRWVTRTVPLFTTSKTE